MNKARLLVTVLASQGAAANPIVLPSTNQIFEFFAGDGLSIPALVTASADGGPVTTWTDKVAAIAPTQSVLAAKPTYHINGFGANGRASIEFDGGDRLSVAIASSILAELANFTLYFVYATSDTNTTRVMYAEANSGNATPLLYLYMNSTTADRVRVIHRNNAGGSGEVVADAAAANNGNLHILALERTGGNISLYFDGSVVGVPAASSGATTINLLSLGADRTGATPYIGQLGLLTAYSAAYSATVANAIKAYYGTP